MQHLFRSKTRGRLVNYCLLFVVFVSSQFWFYSESLTNVYSDGIWGIFPKNYKESKKNANTKDNYEVSGWPILRSRIANDYLRFKKKTSLMEPKLSGDYERKNILLIGPNGKLKCKQKK